MTECKCPDCGKVFIPVGVLTLDDRIADHRRAEMALSLVPESDRDWIWEGSMEYRIKCITLLREMKASGVGA